MYFIAAGSPCGTILQPYPQYSIHFYSVPIDTLESLTCVSGGGFFCSSQTKQCSENGRKFNLDGKDIPTCEDAPPGPPVYQNVPKGFVWTTDNNPLIGINAGTPGMGLHGIDPSDVTRDPPDARIPYHLMLNYDGQVIGSHVLICKLLISIFRGTILSSSNISMFAMYF